ncbi:neural-cadherin-like [Dreissena polymorpha]|uniref:Cadherin domain-containing protein n=1 Tax=Dreissena polymorpha TaxID=45954 RepID=A0A9D4EY11_DREPO|nr:neural-cadherin-like [Dreissena polymorpha]KAH3787943.1 hypothetical protein DPMN_166070 [Dreissena polymorpha]
MSFGLDHAALVIGVLVIMPVEAYVTSTGTSYDDCTSFTGIGADIGGQDPSNTAHYDQPPDQNTAYSFLAETPNYMFKCCGLITSWKLMGDLSGTIQLHVWRRTSNTEYKLIGENYCNYATPGTMKTCTIHADDQILVQKGDFIGWHHQGYESIRYATRHFNDTTLQNMFKRINIGDVYPGDVIDWSETDAYHDREYAILAHYIPSDAPDVHATSIVVPDYLASGTTIGRISFSDPNYMDNRTLTVVATQTSPFYQTDLPSSVTGSGSGYVTAINQFEARDGNLKYYAYDLCYKTSTTPVSHSITVTSTTLKIDNLDATYILNETHTGQKLLHTIRCTDPVDQFYCESDTWGIKWPFMLLALSTTSYGVYVNEYPGFEYTTKDQYTLKVKCKPIDSTKSGEEQSGQILVRLRENQGPSIDNLDGHAIVDGTTAQKGDIVYNVIASDPENDIITFSPAQPCDPTGTFYMTKNGNVVLGKFLTISTTFRFNCSITATDTEGNTDTKSLHISIANVNGAVTIANPVPGFELLEGMPLGTLLWTFQYRDVDSDKKTWSISYSDPEASRYFSLDPDAGKLWLAHSLMNFETISPSSLTTYTLTVTVGDVKSTATTTLTITPLNANEPPWFKEDYYAVEILETDLIVVLGSFFSTKFVDEDKSSTLNTYEVHEYYLDCDSATNTQRFKIDTTSGGIVCDGPYDLDVAGTPDEVTCTVTVKDKYGLSDSTLLYIHVNNVNEYAPKFTQSNYSFYLATNSLVGTYLDTVSAVDFDSSDDDDNRIMFSIEQSTVLAVNHDGSVYLISSLASQSMGGVLGPAYIVAKDKNGGPTARNSSTEIWIYISGSTTTSTTTTDRNLDFGEDKYNSFWLIPLGAGMVMILIAVSLVCARICHLSRIGPTCYAFCMRGPCCQPKPPKPRGFGDKGYDLASFGHRHVYGDEDGAIDGWEPRKKTVGNKRSKVGMMSDPMAHLHDNQEGLPPRKPNSEMFRVNKGYLDPYSNTRNPKSTMVKGSKPLI